MSINEFLVAVHAGRLQHTVICFYAEKPVAFLSQLISACARRMGLVCERLDGDDSGNSTMRLYTHGFCGKQLFWFGEVSGAQDALRSVCLEVLSSYTGPHLIAFFSVRQAGKSDWLGKIEKAASPHVLFVSCDAPVDKTLMGLLGSVLFPDAPEIQWQIPSTLSGRFTVDQAFVLLPYQALGAQSWKATEALWLEKLVAQEESLYTLGQLFLAKNRADFFSCWWRIRDSYPVEFWVVFWGDMLWQAWLFVTLSRAQTGPVDRRLTYRLPFAFTQRSWRSCETAEFAGALNALYTVDHLLKNGAAGDYSLELCLYKYLLGFFAKQAV